MSTAYSKQTQAAAVNYTSALCEDFPDFAKDFINFKLSLLSAKSAKGYATDLKVFFDWVRLRYPECVSNTKDIPLSLITALKPLDLSDYVAYLENDGERMNSAAAVHRKFVTLRQFYDFLFDNDFYNGKNPVKAVRLKRLSAEPDYEHLSDSEVIELLEYIMHSHAKAPIAEVYKEKTRLRDFTIIVTLLGTGLRVSELVGLDISDIDFNRNRLRVVRKGKAGQNSEQSVLMNDDAAAALKYYLPYRKNIKKTASGDENALFLSSQNARIGVTTVETMLKKHIRAIGIDRKISPHKLRKTYGMRLYNNGTDIYVVSKLLGHSDVKVTTQHYVEPSEEKLEEARKKDKL